MRAMQLPKQARPRGWRVGRQAQVMPMLISTVVQVMGRTYDHVTSVWSMLRIAQTRTMAAAQVL